MPKLKAFTPTHVVIPDTQTKAGVPLDHLRWIGQYVVEQFYGRPHVRLIHLGDHFDMPSLSSYDKGKRAMEGRRYVEDVRAGQYAFDLLNEPLAEANEGKRREWLPESCDFLLGNHEHRIERAAESDAQLDGLVSLDDVRATAEAWDWNVHEFLQPVERDGVTYAHYFANPMTGRPYGGQSIDTRLKTIGFSFTMGHQQGLMYGLRSLTNGKRLHGLVAGSCYLHDEEYAGPQGNFVWRGIVVCHQVEGGAYDPMFVSLDYLCRRYEGVRLDTYRPREFFRGDA